MTVTAALLPCSSPSTPLLCLRSASPTLQMDSSSTGRSGGASYAGQQETSAAFDPLHQHQQQYPADHNAENNYPSNHFDRSSSGHMRISVDDSAIDAYRDSPDAYPSLKRVSSMNNMSSSRKSYDDQLFSDPRMQRLQQAEATIRRDMFKECTFRPQIKGLPVAYGPLKETGTPFVMRMEKWKKEREQDLKTKKSISIRSVEDQCSFKPKINKYSDKAVMEIRGPSSPETAHERLFKSSLALIEQRARLLEEESLREQQSIEAQCTFRPSLITKNHPSFQQVTAKFNRVTANHRDESSQRIEAHLNKDCTFTPTVNRVRPSMSSAKLYLSTNVVDRLSRPVTAEPKAADESMLRTFDSSFAESNVIDAATFIGSLHAAAAAGPGTGAGAQSRPTTPGGPAAAAAQTPAKTLTKEEVRARQEKFHNFCSRQQSMLDKKKKSLQEVGQHSIMLLPLFLTIVLHAVGAAHHPCVHPEGVPEGRRQRTEADPRAVPAARSARCAASHYQRTKAGDRGRAGALVQA